MGYPDGMTQALHDRAHNVTALDVARANQRQEQREEEAHDLLRQQAMPFLEWLEQCVDWSDYAPQIVSALNGSRDDVQAAVAIAEQLAEDWKQYYAARDE